MIAYLMETFGQTYKDAFLYVQQRRFCISPNEGFVRQLLVRYSFNILKVGEVMMPFIGDSIFDFSAAQKNRIIVTKNTVRGIVKHKKFYYLFKIVFSGSMTM